MSRYHPWLTWKVSGTYASFLIVWRRAHAERAIERTHERNRRKPNDRVSWIRGLI
jgi:hypothetical protein